MGNNRFDLAVLAFFFFLAGAAASGCDGRPTPAPDGSPKTFVGALRTEAQPDRAARAAAYDAQAAKHRELAAQERLEIARYERWRPAASERVRVNWNEKMRATSLRLASNADALAVESDKAATLNRTTTGTAGSGGSR